VPGGRADGASERLPRVVTTINAEAAEHAEQTIRSDQSGRRKALRNWSARHGNFGREDISISSLRWHASHPDMRLSVIRDQIVACERCPRLRSYCAHIGREKRRAYRDDTYWARPVPGFGDANARILVVGLAPAADGGNRTGRMFTGDRSGDFLFAALHRAEMANQPTSTHTADGLRLSGVYIGAVNRCAPPANRPTPRERDNCLPYLAAEIGALENVRAIVCLGAFAWDGTLRALAERSLVRRPRPAFAHGAEVDVGPYILLGCFHPSQQNTFTGRLTSPMLDTIFWRARELTK
jgi:uracil-DNA glycosylase family 4